jgi:uncharacterized alkaline shock family protein YloU
VSTADAGDALEIAIHITARYGVKLIELGKEVQSAVLDALNSQLSVEAAHIDVYVEALAFDA